MLACIKLEIKKGILEGGGGASSELLGAWLFTTFSWYRIFMSREC